MWAALDTFIVISSLWDIVMETRPALEYVLNNTFCLVEVGTRLGLVENQTNKTHFYQIKTKQPKAELMPMQSCECHQRDHERPVRPKKAQKH